MASAGLWTLRLSWLVQAGVMAGCGGGFESFTASLGGGVAGGRGRVRVVFINHTPFQVACTFGTFDQTDRETQPDFRQFVVDEEGLILEGNSAGTAVALTCGRTFSVGGPGLLNSIERNLPDIARSEESFVNGTHFFDLSSDEAGAPRLVGEAPPFEAKLGVDFPCGALLIIRYEFDDLGSNDFRTDFELIPAASAR